MEFNPLNHLYPKEKCKRQREMALDLLRFPEGSFSHAFLEAFVRADAQNMEILSDDFEVFREKFAWDEKLAKWKANVRDPALKEYDEKHGTA